MNTGKMFVPSKLALGDARTGDPNEHYKPTFVSGNSPKHDKSMLYRYLTRVQELEERNAYLEAMVERGAKGISEISARNSKYISIIAHDLRGPFNSILGTLGLLKNSLNDYDINEIKKFVGIANDSSRNAYKLLENLLSWAVSQTNKENFMQIKLQLTSVLDEEFETVHSIAKQKQIVLIHDVSPDLYLYADYQMVKSIIRNLVSNAVKFTSEGGEISVRASECKPFIEIVVKDNGIGISRRGQKELFTLDSINSIVGINSKEGKGLGLVLCKEFVELHGGNLRLESEPGVGSEFRFTLPRYIAGT